MFLCFEIHGHYFNSEFEFLAFLKVDVNFEMFSFLSLAGALQRDSKKTSLILLTRILDSFPSLKPALRS